MYTCTCVYLFIELFIEAMHACVNITSDATFLFNNRALASMSKCFSHFFLRRSLRKKTYRHGRF